MSGLLQFQALTPHYQRDSLTIEISLKNPVTEEVIESVVRGYSFKIEYTCYVIVNDRRSFQSTIVNTLSRDSVWLVNGRELPKDSINARMGLIQTSFPRLRFDPGDKITEYAKAKIIEDSGFTQSTGLSTSILWNYYIPRKETHWEFEKGKFIPR